MRVDFHVHSFYSDGKHDPRTLVGYARKLGIFIALTDHDTSRGIDQVRGEVIPGQEVTTEFGHVVILCDFAPEPPKSLSSLLDYSRENSCVVFPSHPFDIFRQGIGKQVFNYVFNAIEIFNSKAPRKANEQAEKAAKSLSLPGLANSDSHVKEALGSAYNELNIDEFRVEDVLQGIMKGSVSPRPVGLTATAKLRIAEWYIERKLGLEKNTRRAMREVQGN
ncbi:PHP-associated domain-containing protein [Metallosphaera hakonensis]|uniref:Phosphoesterase n=1 Tax=Metallosphaera hakonensis JCM 8857 = DSM 7519 TaxID=1293036 RepID=A0A2U9IVG4_9CREN|nr:PHP-associated domain-containing protein [Metallosphaera hakonensis]AWR99984.1 PHP domain-containing protein [Metallosphaera hakonensis JCM 8857 = DSM 7519]